MYVEYENSTTLTLFRYAIRKRRVPRTVHLKKILEKTAYGLTSVFFSSLFIFLLSHTKSLIIQSRGVNRPVIIEQQTTGTCTVLNENGNKLESKRRMQEGRSECECVESESESEKDREQKKRVLGEKFDRIAVSIPFIEERSQQLLIHINSACTPLPPLTPFSILQDLSFPSPSPLLLFYKRK